MKGSKPSPVDKDACRVHAVKGIKGGPEVARTVFSSKLFSFTLCKHRYTYSITLTARVSTKSTRSRY